MPDRIVTDGATGPPSGHSDVRAPDGGVSCAAARGDGVDADVVGPRNRWDGRRQAMVGAASARTCVTSGGGVV